MPLAIAQIGGCFPKCRQRASAGVSQRRPDPRNHGAIACQQPDTGQRQSMAIREAASVTALDEIFGNH